jgi:sulfite exporter TauE/SafE
VNGTLTLSAAFVLGLLASGHCLLMCGGLSAALAIGLRRDARGGTPWRLLAGVQLGRIASYALAGASLAGAGAWLVRAVDQETVRVALRGLSAAVIAAVALAMLARGRGVDAAIGGALWRRLAPLARRLLPIRHLGQALAFGAIWGWMPCGFVYSVLLVAWLSLDPWRSAAIMLAFGLGTVPAVLAGAFGAHAGLRVLARAGVRSAVGVALLLGAVLTAGGPWLVAHGAPHLAAWLPFDCAAP